MSGIMVARRGSVGAGGKSSVVPVQYAALGTAGANQNGFTTSLTATGSHTGTPGDTVLIGYASRNGGQSRASQTTRAVNCGGSPATFKGFVEFATNEAYMEFWAATIASSSAQATQVTVGNATNAGRELVINSVSCSGVGSMSVITNSGNSSSPVISSIASAANELVVGMFGSSQAALTLFTPNHLHSDNTSDNFANMILGYAAGAPTVNLGATRAVSGLWGGIALRLQPV